MAIRGEHLFEDQAFCPARSGGAMDKSIAPPERVAGYASFSEVLS